MNIDKAKKQAFELFDQQKIPEAQKAFVKLCRFDRTDTELWLVAGIIEGMLGNLDKAIERFKHIVKLEPRHIDALTNLGFSYEQLGEYKESIDYYKSILKYYPDNANSHFRLGIALDADSKYRQAIKSYKNALALKSDFYEVYYNLGVSYKALDAPVEAIESYKQYKKYNDNTEVNMSIGEAYFELNQIDHAMNYFKIAIDLDKNNLRALKQYADILLKQDNFDEAMEIFSDVLKKDPNDIYALSVVLSMNKANDTREIVDRFESYLDDKAYEGSTSKICFALAEYYDNVKEYGKAFNYLDHGHKILRKVVPYNAEFVEKEFNTIVSVFSKEFISSNQQLNEYDVVPIFIIGMPRSGTTLVEQILATHSDIEGVGEVNSLKKVFSGYFDTEVYTEYYPEKIENLSHDVLQDLGLQYITDIKNFTIDKSPYIINKMPHNFMFVGLIKILFPQAKIILCERDPMDTCWSIFKKDFTGNHEYANSLKELAEYYLLYTKLMAHWKSIFSDTDLYVVNYEELANNPDVQISSLLKYCGVSWQDEILNFHDTGRINKTASEFQVRQKMYTSSIGAWKPYSQFLEPLSQLLEAG